MEPILSIFLMLRNSNNHSLAKSFKVISLYFLISELKNNINNLEIVYNTLVELKTRWEQLQNQNNLLD